jgi:hypothetical protein
MKNKNTGTTSADGLLKLKLFGTDKDALSVVRSWADCTINMAGCGDWSVETMPTDPVLPRFQGLCDAA